MRIANSNEHEHEQVLSSEVKQASLCKIMIVVQNSCHLMLMVMLMLMVIMMIIFMMMMTISIIIMMTTKQHSRHMLSLLTA